MLKSALGAKEDKPLEGEISGLSNLSIISKNHGKDDDENDPILFVVYPGKAKQVNVHTRFLFHKLVHILFFKDTLSLVADVYIVRQRAKPNRSIFL